MDLSHVGVLLVGHGSHLSPDSATPIHTLVRRVEESGGGFGEVRATFWKEEPELRHVLEMMESHEVFVVPVFTSAGYFTETVLPRELGLEGAITFRGGRRIHYAPPVGVHPRMAQIALERAQEVAPPSPEERSLSTLVIVGHGTDLHPGSSGTTHALVERLAGKGYARVLPAFLDQEPKLEDVLGGIDGSAVVVPFFISEGWHAGTTIPRDLGGYDVRYAKPIGTHPGIAEVVREMILALIPERGEEGEGNEEKDGVSPFSSSLPIARAREAYLSGWREGRGVLLQLLQVELRRGEEGGYELRHISDWAISPLELERLEDPGDGTGVGLRSQSGGHRPLRSAPDLRRGWRFISVTPEDIWIFLDLLYPGALFHQHLAAMGQLPIVPFQKIASRQTGIHARVGRLGEGEIADLVVSVCAKDQCLRTPVWPVLTLEAGEGRINGRNTGRGATGKTENAAEGEARWLRSDLPCPEPCSVFISAAAKLERERRRE